MDYKNLEMLTWLVAQFRMAGERGITFEELIDRLVDEPNMDKIMHKRTFYNYLKELRDRFGIKIECDKRLQFELGKKRMSEDNKRYRYHIVEEPQSDKLTWAMPFLTAFETSAAIRKIQDSEDYQKYMYIDIKATGIENVNILMDAIRQQKCVDFSYSDPQNPFTYHQELFEPRGLVQKNQIWYLLGNTNYRIEKIWPLSWLSEITIRDIMYRPNIGFSSEKFWKTHRDLWIDYLA